MKQLVIGVVVKIDRQDVQVFRQELAEQAIRIGRVAAKQRGPDDRIGGMRHLIQTAPEVVGDKTEIRRRLKELRVEMVAEANPGKPMLDPAEHVKDAGIITKATEDATCHSATFIGEAEWRGLGRNPAPEQGMAIVKVESK